MSLEQRTIAYFSSGGTSPPERIPLPGEEEFLSEPANWSGGCQLSNLVSRRQRIFVVSSGTSAEAVGLAAGGFKSHTLHTMIGAWNNAFIAGRDLIKCRDFVRDVGFITETGVGGETALAFDCRDIRTSGFIAGLTVINGGTALVERRHRDTAVAIAQRTQQRKKNEAAIALLETWLAEEADAASEAASLKKTIEALNAERAHSRKLYP